MRLLNLCIIESISLKQHSRQKNMEKRCYLWHNSDTEILYDFSFIIQALKYWEENLNICGCFIAEYFYNIK